MSLVTWIGRERRKEGEKELGGEGELGENREERERERRVRKNHHLWRY